MNKKILLVLPLIALLCGTLSFANNSIDEEIIKQEVTKLRRVSDAECQITTVPFIAVGDSETAWDVELDQDPAKQKHYLLFYQNVNNGQRFETTQFIPQASSVKQTVEKIEIPIAADGKYNPSSRWSRCREKAIDKIRYERSYLVSYWKHLVLNENGQQIITEGKVDKFSKAVGGEKGDDTTIKTFACGRKLFTDATKFDFNLSPVISDTECEAESLIDFLAADKYKKMTWEADSGLFFFGHGEFLNKEELKQNVCFLKIVKFAKHSPLPKILDEKVVTTISRRKCNKKGKEFIESYFEDNKQADNIRLTIEYTRPDSYRREPYSISDTTNFFKF